MDAQKAMDIRNNACLQDLDCNELSKCIDNALEKQIPKYVKVFSSTPDDIYMCPECLSTFCMFEKEGFKVLANYCQNCGQKLIYRGNDNGKVDG